MLHLSEAVVGIKNKPKAIGDGKRFKELDDNDNVYRWQESEGLVVLKWSWLNKTWFVKGSDFKILQGDDVEGSYVIYNVGEADNIIVFATSRALIDSCKKYVHTCYI